MLYDKDIRQPLFDYLEELYGKARILEEKNIGGSRADAMMVIENALIGIEIKSDADSYARLVSQAADYDRYFDYNYIVVGSTHAKHAAEHVPKEWGIISVELYEEQVDFYMLRRPRKNPRMRIENKLEILWRPELAHIQQLNEMPAYKEKSKAFVREKVAQRVPETVLEHQISEELFERDYTTIANTINAYRTENGRGKRRKSYRKKRRK